MELNKRTEQMLRAHGFQHWWTVREGVFFYRKQGEGCYYALRIEFSDGHKEPSVWLWEFLDPKTNCFTMKAGHGACFVSIRAAITKTEPPKEPLRKFSAAAALAVPFP